MLPTLNEILFDVNLALREDIGSGDISAELLPEAMTGHAEIISREPMVVCGQAWALQTFLAVDAAIELEWLVKEGAYLNHPATLCIVKGPVRSILTAERTALNFLQTLSATATHTRQYVEQLKGTSAILLDTRKTIPGLRSAQKYAVVCGGGKNHRLGLYDAFLIKENHIKACGSITIAIEKARILHPDRFLEIEVENIEQLQEAFQAQPDRILLDNFNLEMMTAAVAMNQSGIPLEASGGVSLSNLHLIAATGVNFISVGSITKSIQAIDLSLLLRGR